MSFSRVKAFLIGLILINFCSCLLNLAYADPIEAKLSRNKIALGETLTVSFSVNNTAINTPPDFSALQKDFRILSTNYRTAINMFNGVTQTQLFWEVTLQPKLAGELIIPEINFGNMKSTARKLLVEETAPAPVANEQQPNESVFVQAEITTLKPYVQSQVLYTFKLFYRSQLDNPKIEMPQIKDGVLVQVGEDKSYQTIINGEPYFGFERTLAFFPQKTGKITIPPTQFRALNFDMNMGFLNDPFAITATKPITLKTQSFALDVQPTPDKFQGNIWLPAKNLTITEKWSGNATQWELGNPITRTISIEALGLRADQLPDIPVDNIPGMNIYADPPRRSNRLQDNAVLGTWEQKITYIPNQVQSFTLAAVKLNWWNMQTNANAIAELKATNVAIQPKLNTSTANPTQMPVVMNPIDPPSLATNAQVGKSVVETIPAFYTSIWFWIASGLLLIWLLTLVLMLRRRNPKSDEVTLPAKQAKAVDSQTMTFNEKTFAQICEQGDSLMAQKLLLLWAKNQYEHPPQNLGKLREVVKDENFENEIQNLEQALYAKQTTSWNGHNLLTAYQQTQKKRKTKLTNTSTAQIMKKALEDPLPPLNP